MTGGQMAPTTMPGQISTTTPYGRKPEIQGNPLRICEMMATIDGVAYAERVALDNVKNIRRAKAAIQKAFEVQRAGMGFSIIELLSTCPTNWGVSPVKALDYVTEKMIPFYPLGVYKDITATETKEATK